MPDYQQGKIYCIRSHQTEQIYIGSTTQTLVRRLAKHKCEPTSSKLILQYQDAYIELIELFPCNSKEELNKKEGEHIRANNCVNKVVAGRTIIQYYQDNKEQLNEVGKKYYQENKEQVKEYRQKNKEKKKEYDKQYREQNKEQIKQSQRQYYLKNKLM
jgi:hypothetical protein